MQDMVGISPEPPQTVSIKFFYRREDFEAEASVFHSNLIQAAHITPAPLHLCRFGLVRVPYQL
jgi:hypothetical protein